MFKSLKLLQVSCLVGILFSLSSGCKNIDKGELSDNDTLTRNSRYNFNINEPSSVDANAIDAFLNNSCATLWTNMRELLTVDSTFKVTNQGSKLLGSSLSNSESEYKVTVNSDSDINTKSQSFLKSETFNYYWTVEPPQNLNVIAFNQECKVLQQLVSESLFYAKITAGTVKIDDKDYNTINLNITPSPSDYSTLSDLGILKNYVAVINPPTSMSYSITFTIDHMLILERDLNFTTNAIIGSDKKKTYKSKLSDFVIKK